MQKKSTWNEEYYETLEFYYWEPQHLGKMKMSESKYDSLRKSIDHIKKMEVSLNHHFNTFFSLLPNKETNDLFAHIFGREFQGNFCFNSKATRDFVDSFKSATQPDLFFPSEQELVCIEMKVGSKSSFDQLTKYLLLSLLEQEREHSEKKFSLLYIGVGEFKDLFKEKIRTVEELREQFLQYEIGEKTRNKTLDLAPYREKIYQLSQTIPLEYLSYSDFYRLLSKLYQQSDNEALQNIYYGLIAELEMRGYIS